jgi:SNF2 family DNA or RNA helicase
LETHTIQSSGVLTERSVKQLCGQSSFTKGKALLRTGKVELQTGPAEQGAYSAVVQDKERFHVTIQIEPDAHVQASCSCPPLLSYTLHCKHIAAVLLAVMQEDAVTRGKDTSAQAENPEIDAYSAPDNRLADRLVELFTDKPVRPTSGKLPHDDRTTLATTIRCRVVTLGGTQNPVFGIELKAGLARGHSVGNIRSFLDCVERRQPYPLSRSFSYDPELHRFDPKTDAVIGQLLAINRDEGMQQTALLPHRANDERTMLIPPTMWKSLLSSLTEAPSAELLVNEKVYEGIGLSNDLLPVQFELDRYSGTEDRFVLAAHGINDITIMEAYGIVIAEGRLRQLQADSIRQLSGLKRMVDASREGFIPVPSRQMESFMSRVVPGLMKFGTVKIDSRISDSILRAPLKARLYLDRVRSRLLAGLEFQYGELVINPLDDTSSSRSTGRILLRDGERESAILDLMELSGFIRTEGSYFTDDEDTEYEFMIRIVPQLEKHLHVYASSAVKERIFVPPVPPRISVELEERTDWLDIKFSLDGVPESEIRKLVASLEEKRKFYRLPSGALMPLESAELQAILQFVNETGIRAHDWKGTSVRLPAARALHLIDRPLQAAEHAVKLGKSFRRLLDNMRNPDNLDFPVPDRLDPVLRDYQKLGYQWMKTLAFYRFGGILADDMGLGKTVQSIAFLTSVLEQIRQEQQPALIVCPASLMYNWLSELKKFAPEIRTVIVEGAKSERAKRLKRTHDADVFITSYPLLRRDTETYVTQTFHTLLLDEAQMFKNYTTQTAQSVKEVTAHYRFALTGTPMENRLEELWSIYDAVFPGLFPDRKAFGDLPRETIARRIRPFLLRRLKSDVLRELPEKIETLQSSELLADQKKLYAAYLAKLRKEALKHLDDGSFGRSRIKILAGLTRLRQIICHPALFVEGYTGSSAKFEQLLDIVSECRSAGKRALVFSQFTEMLGLIRRELGLRGVSYFYLDGQTPAPERVELCSRFNEGERDLFLLSLKAGGTGLNLTGADTVILYDMWWNPAVEEQAADRAHRIGQKNVVQVIRLVANGTLEDKMYELQQKKKSLIDQVIGPGEESLSALTEQDIRELLMI